MGSGVKATFLRISGAGTFYISSPEPKEGYVEHYNEKTKATSYWKEYYAVSGWLNKMSIKDTEYNGVKVKRLMVGISDEDGIVYITVPLMTQNGGLNSYAKSLVRYMPNIDLSRKLVIAPARPKTGEQYAPGNFFINYLIDETAGPSRENTELVPQYYKNGVNGWPDRVESTDIMGNKKFDYSAQDRFAMDVLKQAIEKIAKEGKKVNFNESAREEAPKPQPKQETKKETVNTPPPSYNTENAKPAQNKPAASHTQATQQPPQEYFGAEDDLPF